MNIKDRIVRFERVTASQLQPNPKNWRKHPEAQQNALRGVLAEIGFASAVLARETPEGGLRLIDGHLRTETMGDALVPVLVLDLDDAEEAKLLATFDPLGAMAETDAAALDALLREVETANEDLSQMLSDLAEEAGILDGMEPEVTEDEVPEPPVDPITKPGDLWLLGDHRLLCGDSTKPEDVKRLMAGAEKALLMSTDPPYGVDFAGAKYNPRAKQWDGIANDKLQGDDLQHFIEAMLKAWIPYVAKQAGFYFWTTAMQEGAAAAAVKAVGLHIQSQIIWNKNALVLGQADYHWKHENCWYAFWKGEKHRWLGERDKTTVWEVSKVSHSDYVHPMQKPVELYAIPMRHHTYEGEIVVEPFGGSGSQFIAAEQLGRKCYGMEISPQYCDVIVKRWEALTGRQATLEGKK